MTDIAFTLLPMASAPLTDRRRGPRELTLMRVGLIHASGGKEFCLVRNISADGLMARVYRRFRSGEEARVELTNGYLLLGEIVWVHGADIGVQFRQSVDVAEILSARWGADSGKRPRLPRLELNCPAVARYRGRSVPVHLLNISQRGAKIVGPGPIPDFSEIVLSLPDLGCIHGTVRWSRGEESGMFFKESLPFAVLARWVDGRRRLERRPRSDRSSQVYAGGPDR